VWRSNDFNPFAVYLLYRQAAALVEGRPPPDHPLRWFVQARGHAALGQPRRAADAFTRAMELRPSDPALWLARGHFFARRGKLRRAAADYTRAFALGLPDRPGVFWDWHCHALLRLYLGETAAYRRLCRQAFGRFGRVEDVWGAHQLALTGLLTPATVSDLGHPVRLAEQGVAADPCNGWFLLTLAAARHRAGYPAEAVLYLRWALKEDRPDTPFREGGKALAYLWLSLSYRRLGQIDEARRWLERGSRWGSRLKPEKHTGDLGPEYFVWMMCQVVRRESETLLGNSSKNTPARGQALLARRGPDREAAIFSQAVAQRPTDPRVWLTRGHLSAVQGRWARAAADFQRGFALGPPPQYWEWHRHCTLRLWADDRAGYRAVCKQALERFGPSAPSELWQCQQLALLCLLAPDALPELSQLVRLAERAVASESNNPWFLLTLGAARHRTGQFREAIGYLNRASRGRWSDEEESRVCGTALTRLFLSMAHSRLGEADEARRQLRQAARSIAAAASGPEGKGNRGKEWHIWAACQVLQREAQNLVKHK
jgi:tetratricopeptide (TPR) repeat protein